MNIRLALTVWMRTTLAGDGTSWRILPVRSQPAGTAIADVVETANGSVAVGHARLREPGDPQWPRP